MFRRIEITSVITFNVQTVRYIRYITIVWNCLNQCGVFKIRRKRSIALQNKNIR